MALLESASKKALLARGLARGEVAIEDAFSTYLYEGTGGAQTISNGFNLIENNGLVWVKNRVGANEHALVDTIRGDSAHLETSTTAAENIASNFLVFETTGFSLDNAYGQTNANGDDYVSWTFRDYDRFFTLTEVSHTNGSETTVDLSRLGTVGMVTVKRVDSTSDWYTWHRGLSAGDLVYLNLATGDTPDPSISVSGTTLTIDSTLATGTYVVYAWAHDPLGPSGDGSDGLIECGSYTGNGSFDGPEIDLGWEPQLIIVKNIGTSAQWAVWDVMRGIVTGDNDQLLVPNTADAESSTVPHLDVKPNGFKIRNSSVFLNGGSQTIIYLAIRRGPMGLPSSGTDVFAIDTMGGTSPTPPRFNSGWPVDWAFYKDVDTTAEHIASARLMQGLTIKLNSGEAEGSTAAFTFDFQNGVYDQTGTDSTQYAWMFRRYPSVCDVVTYEGDGVAGRTVPHNLGVVPEMMVVKDRDTSNNWVVYHKSVTNDPETDRLILDTDGATSDSNIIWNDTLPTQSEFTLGSSAGVNSSGDNYIALLFATLDGISKVGSYTGTGSALTIDCGFTSGARFVWIKRWDSTGDWILWDSERGIVAGNEPYLETNTTNAQVTGNDYIDPDSSGFTINGGLADVNANGGEYIFLAFA